MAKSNGADLSTRLPVAPGQADNTLVKLIERMKPEIDKALPKFLGGPERFARIALTAIRVNPNLQNTDGTSFIAALMQSAQLGLEPNTPLGEAYLIPYGRQCQFQLGYQVLISLAHRTGEYKVIYAMEVYANDEFRYGYGLEPYLVHKPADDPEGAPTYYYAVYQLRNGGSHFVVWSRKKIERHREQFSKAKGFSPWDTNFDGMAKKTVLKDLLRYAPKSIEFARQFSMDETIKTEIHADMSEAPAVEPETIDVPFVPFEEEVKGV